MGGEGTVKTGASPGKGGKRKSWQKKKKTHKKRKRRFVYTKETGQKKGELRAGKIETGGRGGKNRKRKGGHQGGADRPISGTFSQKRTPASLKKRRKTTPEIKGKGAEEKKKPLGRRTGRQQESD